MFQYFQQACQKHSEGIMKMVSDECDGMRQIISNNLQKVFAMQQHLLNVHTELCSMQDTVVQFERHMSDKQ